MNLIVRADDLGMSKAVNYGIFDAAKAGALSSVGVMTNMDAAAHGAQLLGSTALELGLHVNISTGAPLCSWEEVSSLTQEETRDFCTSGMWRKKGEAGIIAEELLREIRAQYRRFEELFGRPPAYMDGHGIDLPLFQRMIRQVAEETGVHFVNVNSERWQTRWQIHSAAPYLMDARCMYDPYAYILQDDAQLLSHPCAVVVFHPGYMDRYLNEHSSFTAIRMMECAFLMSDSYREWLQQHHVRLVTFTEQMKEGEVL